MSQTPCICRQPIADGLHLDQVSQTQPILLHNNSFFTSLIPSSPQTPNKLLHPSAGEMRQAGVYSGIMLGKKNGPHPLPLSRIKKIMKQSGEDVKMISCESPLVFTKACELFIQELTCRAYKFTLQGKRRTVRKEDIAAAVTTTDVFDFLVDMVSASAAVKTETSESAYR